MKPCPRSAKCNKQPGHIGRCNTKRVVIAAASVRTPVTVERRALAERKRKQPGHYFETGLGKGPVATKPAPKQKKIKLTLRGLLAQRARRTNFLKTLTALYSQDYLAPGIVISWLDRKEVCYASIVRYDTPKEMVVEALKQGAEFVEIAAKASTKQVLYKACAATEHEAVDAAIDQFMSTLESKLKGVSL